MRALLRLLLLGVQLGLACDGVSISAAEREALPNVIEFNRDVRPILSDACYFCHGPDKNKRRADLRLDRTEGLLGDARAGTSGVVVPGQPDESELYLRIMSEDAAEKMPPAESGKSLTSREIAILRRWIVQGANYEGHWAFQPIRRPAVPALSASAKRLLTPSDTAPSSAIDAFVLQVLAEKSLTPSPPADRATLLRRLSLDLTGLPPNPEEVSVFMHDGSPQAYEEAVDRLLSSVHFGERMAMWWLDLVRYADSVGYHADQEVGVSPFRRYVIDAFNTNKRFDRFTLEQLAGDLLPDRSREELIAAGYNRLGMMSGEGGVQDKEYLAKYIAERVRNASGTWLGVTLGCCECHDHKFDPFTTRDFYRFEGFFADIQEQGLYAGGEGGNWGPSMKVPDEQQAGILADLDVQIADIRKTLNTATPQLESAQSEWEPTVVPWTVLKPVSFTSAGGATLTLQTDGSILASGTSPANDVYTLTFENPPRSITGLRIEVLPDDSLRKKGPGRAPNGNFVLSEVLVQHKPMGGSEQPVPLQNGSATYEQILAPDGHPYGRWTAAAAIDGDVKGAEWGWAILEEVGRPNAAVFETAHEIPGGENSTLVVTLLQNHVAPEFTLGRFRMAVTTAHRPVRASQALPDKIELIRETTPDRRTPAEAEQLAAYYRSIAPILEPARRQLESLEKSRREVESRAPSMLLTVSIEPRMIRVLPRGNWMDDSGEAVSPGFPAIFASASQESRNLTRRDLAEWIVHRDNPLTARVFVNRIWKLLFGAGMSRRLDDLGAQGESPSHPLLLDYLAGQFVDSGWDIKQLMRSIVLSRAYQQSSLDTPESKRLDPANRWLGRQGRFRLDAELVRDNALSISGLLTTSIGGPSVKPYQPAGFWAHLNYPPREWHNSAGADLYRRGLYTHWQRQYLHPSLRAFDAPSREECTADRARSNTPLQALVLLNDPTYVEAARTFAANILRQGGQTQRDRFDWAFQRALSRPIRSNEAEILASLFEAHLSHYRQDHAAADELLAVGINAAPANVDKAELAAWTSIARAILNLHETITRN